MKKLIIGIDPDIDRNGFALWHPASKKLELHQFTMFPLMTKLIQLNHQYDLTVRLEAGHKVKQFWQKRTVKVAKDVGANNAVGKLIEQFMKHQGIRYELVAPQGYSSWTHDQFCKLTGWPIKKLTNPEKRVAGLLVFGAK